MTELLIHAGFHKTGTTSLQHYLSEHRESFAPWFTYLDSDDAMRQLTRRARAYAQRPFPWRLAQFQRAAATWLAQLPDNARIVVSQETLCGVMPGHRDMFGRAIRDYSAAPNLAAALVDAAHARFGPEAKITLLYTIRQKDDWLHSAYGHLLRSIRIKLDFESFAELFNHLDLQDRVERVAAAAPRAQVLSRQLEELSGTRAGPASAVLTQMGVPTEVINALPAAPRHNIGQGAALRSMFLQLNRSHHCKDRLHQLKHGLIARHENIPQ